MDLVPCSRAAKARRSSVTDGISNTLFVVEAAKPVSLTKPEDVKFDITQTKVNVLPLLGGQFDGGFHAVFADGGTSVFIKKSISLAAPFAP